MADVFMTGGSSSSGSCVVSGLPSGCVSFAGYTAERDGSTIRIEISNFAPAGDAICTMIYGMHEIVVDLGTDFDSGETYTVNVNGQALTFTAQ
jgi:hypothetical protein